jgi:hypothetical protein
LDEQQDQSLPGCGKSLPIDDPINSPLPGCGGKIDIKPEDFILKASPVGDLSGVDVEFREDNRKHIFDDKPGHLIDTPENRERIEKLVKDPTKYLGPDKHGNWWYGEILPDGTQLWGSVWGDIIGNCGLNEIPEQYNKDTGLCKPSAPNNQKK